MGRAALLGAAWILLASCDAGRLQPTGRPVAEVWSESGPELRIAAEASPLAAPKEVPVLSAPEVFAVYVPGHLDRTRDLLVGEHWVYFKLKDGDWYIERGMAPEPPAAGDAPDSALAPLRRMDGLDRSVVPWKDGR